MISRSENIIEEAALAWFKELGYDIVFGPSIAPEEPNAERFGWDEVVLQTRLRAAIERINRTLPDDVLADVVSRVCRTLVSFRDTLLPKLMSGDNRGKDAENFVGTGS